MWLISYTIKIFKKVVKNEIKINKVINRFRIRKTSFQHRGIYDI